MRRAPMLKKGDHIRLKVRTMFGWKGRAVVMEDQTETTVDATIRFRKYGEDGDMSEYCYACRHEVAKIRRPTP